MLRMIGENPLALSNLLIGDLETWKSAGSTRNLDFDSLCFVTIELANVASGIGDLRRFHLKIKDPAGRSGNPLNLMPLNATHRDMSFSHTRENCGSVELALPGVQSDTVAHAARRRLQTASFPLIFLANALEALRYSLLRRKSQTLPMRIVCGMCKNTLEPQECALDATASKRGKPSVADAQSNTHQRQQ